MKSASVLLVLFACVLVNTPEASAQQVEASGEDVLETRRVSAARAFALSMVVPGLGHRHAQGGSWDGWASVFAVADATLWTGLLGVSWRRTHVIESYETLAVKHAGVDETGKDRQFYLYAATYSSSDEFTDAQLRSRNWGEVDYAADPSNRWDWDTQDNFLQFRELREDAESLARRRSVLISSLVANRLLASITALRAARRATAADLRISFAAPPAGSDLPLVRLSYDL